jgi:hypothetical protein
MQTAQRLQTAGRDVVIASSEWYGDAERAIQSLARHGFPVERVTLVGRGLSLVERVSSAGSRLDAILGSATWSGVAGGGVGLALGALGTPVGGAGLLLWGLLLGVVIGALFGVLTNRDAQDLGYDSLAIIKADRFDIAVDSEYAEEAEALISDPRDGPRRVQ